MPVHTNTQNGGFLAQAGTRTPQTQEPIANMTSIGPGEDVAGAESQDAYDRVVMAGMKILFEDEKTREQIVKRLKADADNPAKTLADTVAIIMIQLEQQADNKIPADVIVPAAGELLEQTIDLADSLNLFPIDDAVKNHAAQLLSKNLAEEYGTQPEEVQELMDSMSPEELQQIEQEQGNFARKQPPKGVV